MVMEAATLSGPQRKCNVVPAQKSLSLPSYAKAGGEGIDHRLIFAELEQKEKVRRKSRIFTKEKTGRQNIFCIPISSGSKCRETSLSSDTSCSSLEYQKPKAVSKPKKEESKKIVNPVENDPPSIDHKIVKTNQQEIKTNPRKDILTRNGINGCSEQTLRVNDHNKESHHSSVETFRLNVGSSDSMERSSRSSNDSLTRKERLVAIKARVEAEREKYGNSSSDEDSRSSITRYNSDGVIHRTVREVKSRSYRLEKRLRRRSQDEWALKKAYRKKNNLSLCLNPEEDGIKLHLERISQMDNETNSLEVKTDYCPSPSFPDMIKKNYFSDFPTRENVTRFVQQRIKLLEEEERKRRSGSDFFDKIKSSRLSPLSQEKSTYASTEHVNMFERKTTAKDSILDTRSASTEFVRRDSPIPRSSQAPTPPPRSPKSITFVNKAFLHHQNSTLQQENNLDKKKIFQPNITAVAPIKATDKLNAKTEIVTRNSKVPYQLQTSNSTDKQQMRELLNDRRKTCGNFDFLDQNVLNDLSSTRGSVGFSHLNLSSSSNSSSLTQIKGTDSIKGSLCSKETSFLPTSSDKNKFWLNKWEESECRREFMFNSLENKKKSNPLPWSKWRVFSDDQRNEVSEEVRAQSPYLDNLEIQSKYRIHSKLKWKVVSEKFDACICHLSPESKRICDCKNQKISDANKNTEKLNSDFNIFQTTEKNLPSPNSKWKNITENANTCLCCLISGNKTTCECKNYEKALNNTNNLNIQSTDLKSSCQISNKDEISIEKQFLSKILTTFNNSPVSISYSKQCTPSQSVNLLNGNASDYKPKEAVKCNEELKNNYSSDSSATANLESAMAELENVYRSLKFSSDTLSDKNSLSNLSLSDEDAKVFNKDNSLNTNSHSKRLSFHESANYVVGSCSISDSFNRCTDVTNVISCNKVPAPSKDVEFLQDTAINELFNDLTTQLDTLEHKLDARDGRKLKEIDSRPLNKAENKQQINSSEIRAKKEFYENLNNQQNNSQKKKLKAVRSLSENISFLMASTNNNNRAKSKNSPENNSQTNNYSNGLNKSENSVNSTRDEIRHVRVSMDTTKSQIPQIPINSTETNQYSRLSSVVRSPQMSPRCETPKPFQFVAPGSSKEAMDKTMDGLEELLSSLLSDVSETNQSSLSSAKDVAPTPPSPISTGQSENVKVNSYILPSKMDMCFTLKSKNETSDSRIRNAKTEEKAQKENTDFRQNNNAHLDQTSFIPIYTKKSDMCHYLSDKGENQSNTVEHKDNVKYINVANSPPSIQKCSTEQSEKLSVRSMRTHMRRRSVGFEDMTSLNSCYISSEKSRVETGTVNSNFPVGADMACSKMLNSDNDISFTYGKRNQRENGCRSAFNQNSRVMKNANDQIQTASKPYQQYKDKSSKRKSSLNRMDFIDIPVTCTENNPSRNSCKLKNSSSEEDIDIKSSQLNKEFLISNSKRKDISSRSGCGTPISPQKNNEDLQKNSSLLKNIKINSLPKSLQNSHKLRQHKRAQFVSKQLQKHSHSAGELESLTDERNGINKVCLSAQELDPLDSNVMNPYLRTDIGSNSKKCFLPPSSISKNSNLDASQSKSANAQSGDFINKTNVCENAMTTKVNAKYENCLYSKSVSNSSDTHLNENETSYTKAINNEPVLSGLNLNDSFDLKHIDSKSEDDLEVMESASKLSNLEISEEKVLDTVVQDSDDNCDSACSDGEKRPSSILRRKFFGERKELHGILKPPPDEIKSSKTPPSILKHRESSEEKDVWQQSDLHSILKKSTSEDESYNSGPDIRPILKVSTDEESPGGSTKPRPILKKRTSFSEECSYASFPSGELKPILKKKTPLSNDDQPRPILKSRRKSEDTRSTLSEFVASRPRAYSADMGVKSNHETKLDDLEQKTEDFCNRENQPL